MSKNTKTTEITFNALCSGEELFQFFQNGDKKVRKLAVAEAERRAKGGSTSKFPYKVLGVTKTTYRQAEGDLDKAKELLQKARAERVVTAKPKAEVVTTIVADEEELEDGSIIQTVEPEVETPEPVEADEADEADNGGIPLTPFQAALLKELKDVTDPKDLDAAAQAAQIPTPGNELGQAYLAALNEGSDEDEGDEPETEDEETGVPSDEDLAALVAQAEAELNAED